MKTMNMISRRSFLKATAAAAVVSALGLTGCGSSGSSAAASSTASSAAGSAAAASEAGQTFKVGIVNYVDHASLNQIVASVESRLDKVGAEKGVTFDYADYYANAQADQSNLNQIGADLVADQVDVIVAVATPTAATMLAAVEDTDIPVVYSAVTDPVSAGFDGEEGITGTSDALNTEAIMNLITAINPDIDTIGLLYDLSQDASTQAIADAKRTRQPHNKARETFVRDMLSAMRNRYVERLDYEPEQAELNDVMQQLCMNDDLRKTLNLAWLPMTGEWLVDQLFAKPQQLRRFAPWLEERDIKTLTRPKGSPFTVSDVPLLDEAMELLGPDPKAVARQKALDAKRAEEEQFAKDTLAQAGIGSGIVTSQMLVDNINGMDAELTAQRAAADREWTYGHIVVDEAQELTAMDWRMLIRRCPSRSFTIVGDVAQTSALGGTRSWRRMMDPLFGERNWQLNELTINYRNPKEVSQLASDFASSEGLYISTVNAVRGVPDSVKRLTLRDDSLIGDAVAQQTVELVRAYVSSDGTGRVAIIAPDDMLKPLRARVYAQLQDELDPKEFDRLDAQSSWDEQVTVCSTQTVKGLEYDAVMVVQPGRIEENAPSRIVAASDLYVAMTRPTQRLLILRTKDDEKLLKL